MLNIEDIINSDNIRELYRDMIKIHVTERVSNKNDLIKDIRAFAHLDLKHVSEYLNDPEIIQELRKCHRFSFFNKK